MNNPELWEMLGLQALHRSDYLFAAEMLAKAAAVSPIKRRLLHALAEVYCALGQQERALPLAEKVPNAVLPSLSTCVYFCLTRRASVRDVQALSLQPDSAVLRNLVLLLAPDTYAERLRNMGLSDRVKATGSILKRMERQDKREINQEAHQMSRLIEALDSDEGDTG